MQFCSVEKRTKRCHNILENNEKRQKYKKEISKFVIYLKKFLYVMLVILLSDLIRLMA